MATAEETAVRRTVMEVTKLSILAVWDVIRGERAGSVVNDQNKEERRPEDEMGTVPFILFLCMGPLVLFLARRILLTVSIPIVHLDYSRSYWGREVLPVDIMPSPRAKC
jgi:hypothetical protein